MTVTELHPTNQPPDTTRQPQHDDLAEQSVLGACLLDGRAIDDVIDVGFKSRDFYRPAHELIWDAIRSLHDAREPVDAVTVPAELDRRGHLARAGGHLVAFDLQRSTPAAANVTYYARIVREKATLRGLVTAGTRVTQLGYAPDGGNVDELVNAAQAEVAAVAEGRHAGRASSLADIADRALDAIETGVKATPTPWADLNHLIDGLVPSCLYATGARPGVGKTIFALQWAFAFAAHHRGDGPQVAYFTLEMSAERLYQRALATGSGVDVTRIRKGTLRDEELSAIVAADGRMRDLPIVLEGASGWTPQQVRARARQLHRERPVGLVVVDHIGLTRAERSRDNRQGELSEAADVLLATAHDLGCAVHVLTQLNRGVTQRSDQRPVPSDIRDTDRIEQNADVVMLLHRDKDKHPEDLQVAVSKNRDGTEGACVLEFDGARSQVRERPWQPHHAAGLP